MAAMGLEKAIPKHHETRTALLRVFPGAELPLQAGIVRKLHLFGPEAAESIDLLIRVASSSDSDVSLRAVAITALAHMTPDESRIDDALMALLENPEWELVEQAAAVLSARHNQSLPMAAIECLLRMLGHEDVHHRMVAAAMLSDARQVPRLVAQTLLNRLEQEEVSEIEDILIRELVRRAPETMRLTVERLPGAGIKKLAIYQYLLWAIATQRPVEVAKLLESSDHTVRTAIAWVLHRLGPYADDTLACVLPLLESADRDVVHDALIALGRTGPAAARAALRLGELLAGDDAELSDCAEEALISIGYSAIPALRAARDLAGSAGQAAIDRVLEHLSYAPSHFESPQPAATEIEQPIDVLASEVEHQDLELFYVVGQLLLTHGALSFQRLHDEVQSRKKAGTVRPGLSCGASTIRLTIAKLERTWPAESGETIILIDRARNAKGGLTKQGRAYLQRVAEFLELPVPPMP